MSVEEESAVAGCSKPTREVFFGFHVHALLSDGHRRGGTCLTPVDQRREYIAIQRGKWESREVSWISISRFTSITLQLKEGALGPGTALLSYFCFKIIIIVGTFLLRGAIDRRPAAVTNATQRNKPAL